MYTSPNTYCLNCNTPLTNKYCPECGQSATVGKITFRETLENFFSSIFALEGPLFHSIKLMLINPGRLFREFLGGKRKQYYKPVAFFVVTTAFYIILRSLINYDPLEGKVYPDASRIGATHQLFQDTTRFMVDNINNIMFTLVFAIGLMLKLFFWKKYNLAEYVTIGFYIAGMYIIFGIVFMLVFKFTGWRQNQYQLVFLALYIFYNVHSFFKINSPLSILKYLLISILSIACYSFLGYGLSFLIVWFAKT